MTKVLDDDLYALPQEEIMALIANDINHLSMAWIISGILTHDVDIEHFKKIIKNFTYEYRVKLFDILNNYNAVDLIAIALDEFNNAKDEIDNEALDLSL